MPLKIGDPAPDFELPSKQPDGVKRFRLSNNFGRKNTLLLFVPMAFTGVCTKELCEVSQGLQQYLGLNAEVWAISGDNPFAQEEWARKERITVPLLADYEHRVAAAYGCAYDSFLPGKNLGLAGVPKRSAFVIDRQGVIRYAEINEDAGRLPDFEAIQQALTALR